MPRLTFERFEEAAQRFENAETAILPNWRAGCDCRRPGELQQCWNCPYYKGLGRLIQKSLHNDPDQAFALIPPPKYEDVYSSTVKQRCCEMYEHGYPIQEIQDLVGVPSRRILRNWLREVGLPGRSESYPEEIKQKCLTMYADRLTVRQIEEETGVPADTITDWALHEQVSRSRKYPEETRQQCLELYRVGHTSDDIHIMTGICAITIRSWIANEGIGRGQKHYSDADRLKCRKLYREGKTSPEIETITGIKQATIRSWIRKERWNDDDTEAQNIEAPKLTHEIELSRPTRLKVERKPPRYWNNFEIIKTEILRLNQDRDQIGVMPTANELIELGRGDLQKAISKHHGGFQSVAERLGLKYRKKKGGYWHDFENVKQELFTFIKQHGVPGRMPTKTELEAVQMGSICMAISLHGGFPSVAKKLKLALSYDRKPRGYWKDLNNLKVELASVAEQLGNPNVLPTHEELKQIGRTDLINAIASNGGWPSVARKIGFSYSKQYNNPNDYCGNREGKKELVNPEI